jgi:hypothetical protein
VPYNETVARYLAGLYSRLTDECGTDWKTTEVGQVLVGDMIEYAADIDYLVPEIDSDINADA